MSGAIEAVAMRKDAWCCLPRSNAAGGCIRAPGAGPPYTIRTCDRSLRRRVLYPTELRAGIEAVRMITRGNCTVSRRAA